MVSFTDGTFICQRILICYDCIVMKKSDFNAVKKLSFTCRIDTDETARIDLFF